MMKKNMGGTDRIIRICVALLVVVLYWQGYIQGTTAYIALGLATLFVLTSFISFCPLYKLIGVSSCPRK